MRRFGDCTLCLLSGFRFQKKMCDGTGLHGDDGDAVALGFFCLVPFFAG